MYDINGIAEKVKKNISASRYSHVLGVVETARILAGLYGVDEDKAAVAALLHDYYRELSDTDLRRMQEEVDLKAKYRDNINLAHGPLAALMLQAEFSIDDEDIKNAITYHTTGRKAMSTLEKIILIADGCEPSRKYPGVDLLRKLALASLDGALLFALESTNNFVRRMGLKEDQDTLEAITYYKSIMKEEEGNMDIREQAYLAAKVLDDKKAVDIEIIDIKDKATFADYFVIATGTSERHAASLADDVQDELAKEEVFVKNIEGKHGTGWILLDYNDFIVNVFTEETRAKYSLEEVWADCGITKLEE